MKKIFVVLFIAIIGVCTISCNHKYQRYQATIVSKSTDTCNQETNDIDYRRWVAEMNTVTTYENDTVHYGNVFYSVKMTYYNVKDTSYKMEIYTKVPKYVYDDFIVGNTYTITSDNQYRCLIDILEKNETVSRGIKHVCDTNYTGQLYMPSQPIWTVTH